MDEAKIILKLLADIKQGMDGAGGLSARERSSLKSHLQAAAEILAPTARTPAKRKSAAGTGQTDTTIKVWSDGACSGNPGPGGWGTIVYQNGEYQELSGFSPSTTNNIMEMTGALEGIRNTPEGCELTLISDSQYLVKGMTEWITGWKRKNWRKADGNPVLNQSIWMALDREAALRQITWKWIKGHAGHPQNERCDELARMEIAGAGRNS